MTWTTHPPPPSRWFAALVFLGALATGVSAAGVDYNRDVRPILATHCYACHGPDAGQRQAGLRLDLQKHALAPLHSGASAVVPGNSAESELVARIFSTEPTKRMPPASEEPLTEEERRVLKSWIDAGAAFDLHWAFAPRLRPPQPTVHNWQWLRNPIDRFVLARLEAVALAPAEEADRVTLIRRLSLDLRGLPPTLAEVDAFLADESPHAYERVVDHLLADSAYGEKMATGWLDLARFGDTNGYQDDGIRAMWPYRDYVIHAFNSNMPFDQFTWENIAGDLLPNATLQQKVASGFNRNHRFNEEGGSDPDEFLVVYAVDRTNTTATTWLGLTFECAQCHDHKYDPISQKDYYQLYAFFNSLKDELGVSKASRQPPFLMLPTREQEEKMRQLDNAIDETAAQQKARANAVTNPWERLVHPYRIFVDHDAWTLAKRRWTFAQEREQVDRDIATTMVMEPSVPRRQAFVLQRGSFQDKGDPVSPDVPTILPPLRTERRDRLALAQWLTDPDHPLVTRVIVNRIWKQLFGIGIVKTVNDFGTRGELPSHPALLDWLTTEFVRLGWNVKALQRLLVTSSTYRQSAVRRSEGIDIDPENRLLWHAPRYRLGAEEIRDNALAIAGLLSRKLGGPSVMPYQPAKYFVDKSGDWLWEPSPGEDQYRRGVYTFWRRTTPYPALVIFDAPSREVCTAERPRTNTPLQALVTLNDPVFVEAARAFAQRVLLERGQADPEAQLVYAFRVALARHPSAAQINVLREVLQAELAHYRADRPAAEAIVAHGQSPRPPQLDVVKLAAWLSVTNVLLNLDETITRE